MWGTPEILLGSGVTAIIFDEAVIASVDVRGGGPGTRETALLDPAHTVESIDAIVLSGGSAFGLDAASGVQAWLREQGRGFRVREARVPIVSGAILFDLLAGGGKNWGRYPPYRELGYEATRAAGNDFALGSAGAGLGATTVNLKGGIGSASAVTRSGIAVGALAAANAAGSMTIGDGPHFWAAPFEQGKEFGGLGWPATIPPAALEFRSKGVAGGEYDPRRRCDRCQTHQGPGQTPCHHGANRFVPGDLSGSHPARWRPRFRRRDRTKTVGGSGIFVERTWDGGGECPCPGDRSRNLRGDGVAVARRLAKLARPIWFKLKFKLS